MTKQDWQALEDVVTEMVSEARAIKARGGDPLEVGLRVARALRAAADHAAVYHCAVRGGLLWGKTEDVAGVANALVDAARDRLWAS